MKLIVVCSWCSRTLGQKDCDVLDESLPRITHSICSKCHSKVLDDLNRPGSQNQNDKSQLTKEGRL